MSLSLSKNLKYRCLEPFFKNIPLFINYPPLASQRSAQEVDPQRDERAAPVAECRQPSRTGKLPTGLVRGEPTSGAAGGRGSVPRRHDLWHILAHRYHGDCRCQGYSQGNAHRSKPQGWASRRPQAEANRSSREECPSVSRGCQKREKSQKYSKR